MKERLEEAMESANNAVDQVALRTPNTSDKPGRQDAGQSVTRIFPYFVVAVLILWIISFFWIDTHTVPKAIEILCLSFTFCFAIFGLFCAVRLPSGIFPFWALAGYATGLTVVLWSFNYITGDNYYANAINDILGSLGIHLSDILYMVVGFLSTLAVMLFTSIGVTTVISAYLRRYIPYVLNSMNEHAKMGIRGKSERFFMIPDIVDIQEVVLDPSETSHIFNFQRSLSISMYLFVLGLLVSSYLFVNPYFLDVMSWKTMLSITLMLSMFTPALILPWQIFRSIGARARSEAHREYHLWIGAKNRLFTTFTALGVFMMMFLLSVYLGNNAMDIIRNYLIFLVPLLLTSAMYGTLYCNNFEKYDKERIVESFDEMRTRDRSPFDCKSSKGGKRLLTQQSVSLAIGRFHFYI